MLSPIRYLDFRKPQPLTFRSNRFGGAFYILPSLEWGISSFARKTTLLRMNVFRRRVVSGWFPSKKANIRVHSTMGAGKEAYKGHELPTSRGDRSVATKSGLTLKKGSECHQPDRLQHWDTLYGNRTWSFIG